MVYVSQFRRRRPGGGKPPRQSAGSLAGDAPAASGEAAAPDRHTPEGRRALLDRIAAFMLSHGLAVTGANLALVCNALSGASAELAASLAAREAAGEPIDQRWLDTLMRLDPEIGGRMAELEKLTDRLEYAVLRFARTTKTAQDETSGHRGAIGAQIEAMAQASLAGGRAGDLGRVIEMSRTMLARIEQVEQAMEKSQAETRQLRENLARARMEADVDHLTRLPNRRAFERRFAAAIEEARAKGTRLCVAFCDVDRFKAINDTFGHDAGDRILCAIAGTLGSHASDTVFVARHGGEEFAVLLQGFDRAAAWRRLDTMRRAQADRQLLDRETGRPFGKVTFSAGVAEVTDHADPRGALGRADAALYEAKKAGRNRVIAA
ncbi:diguanylate cyclase [Erythrobacter sp. HL-111]|uniref:GGDEF domain-containing protein n=1 Tax=Erythrobacter sp. HL-111 TaxID=1798193 RepID=UPI0006DAE4FC|nr:GGDEF domain-containing protein [Erythrobacter sp. HL-111]KPP92558.1 MAG: diguanylate cyclase [Erythrobacteraceae bacterium HL-111]SDS91909.1 diguanylate cyclase [Erythrobacter sp. HL-111]